jgi:hypothetical protein
MIAAREIANDIDVNRLPRGLAKLIEVIGIAPALRLVERRGGGRLYVPQKLDPGHPLVHLLGVDAAHRLIAQYRACVLEVPKHDCLLRALRDQEIRRRRLQGECAQRLADEYWLSLRHIRRITVEH